MFRSLQHLTAIASTLLVCLTHPAFAAQGDLDKAGFGASTGQVVTPIGAIRDQARAVAVQADGRIVAAGYCDNGSNDDFCVARYLRNGDLDTSFNGTGKVVTPVDTFDDRAYAAAVQADGKIVLAGRCATSGTSSKFCLVRYLSNGALDTSFNGTGKVITSSALGNSNAMDMALQADGKIVVAGYCKGTGFFEFCVTRYLDNGTPDPGFNGGVFVTTSVGPEDNTGNAVAIQDDGKIVLAGACSTGSLAASFCLARFSTGGALDTSFNGTGKVLSTIGSSLDQASAVAMQSDGKIVVAGTCYNGSANQICVARYLTDGALDATFNGTGKLIDPVTVASVGGIAVQTDGKIIVAATCSGSNSNFCLTRYLASGVTDLRFGSGGKIVTDFAGLQDVANAVVLQPDGKVVAAGFCNKGLAIAFCLARYEGDPRTCTPDLDGDGAFQATTDALINTRVALGITGNAVVSGISFAPGATRNTWPLIREYLVTQCGLVLGP